MGHLDWKNVFFSFPDCPSFATKLQTTTVHVREPKRLQVRAKVLKTRLQYIYSCSIHEINNFWILWC